MVAAQNQHLPGGRLGSPVHGKPPRFRRAAALLFLAVAPVLASDKTDVVFLTNGDRVTGEVKELKHGRLTYKTDSLGTVLIEWDDIQTLTSRGQFRIESEAGELHFGSLASASEERDLRVGDEVLSLDEVVAITPVKQTFWAQLDGSFDLGLSLTQSGDTAQGSLHLTVNQQRKTSLRRLKLDSFLSRQKNAEPTRRHEATFEFNRLLKRRWSTVSFGQVQSNEELGLDLRLLAAGAVQRRLIQTNTSDLSISGGLALSREILTGVAADQTTTEGLFAVQYSRFFFDDPELDVEGSLIIFPNVSNFGRLRAELKWKVRRELLEDFFWNLNLLDSYDSDPPAEDAEKNDLAVSVSFGWSF